MDNFEIVKSKVNLMDVVQETLTLKRNNRTWKGLCPFHDEKTPSFTVFPQTQTFHCFGCNANGTVIDYIMQQEGIKEPHEALNFMADKYNIALQGFDQESWKKRKAVINESTSKSEDFYKNVAAAKEYILSRGITGEIAKRFSLGYKKETNAITIPFQNTYGEVVGITERSLDENKPKYINSAESETFKKSELLYGLDKARKNMQKKVYVVEGYFDVMAMHQLGYENVVAYCGQSLTDGQAFLLSKYITNRTKIYLIPDNDDTGSKSVRKNIVTLRAKTKNPIGIITLPDGCKDANDFLLSGSDFKKIKSEHHEMYLLKQDLDQCLDIEDQYEVSREYSKKVRDTMIRAEMADYLSKRWNKPISLVREHMNTNTEMVDYTADLHSFSQSYNDYLQYLQLGSDGKVFTNLTGVDKLIKGMRPGEVCTLLGRSGAGKTTFILNLIYNSIIKQNHNVIFNSLELSRVNVVPQLMQIHIGETEGKVANIALSGEADERIMELFDKLEGSFRIVDKGGQSLKDIELYVTEANRSVFDKPVSVVVIDYFQYLKSEGKKQDYHEKSDMARELKEMAKRLNCVVVALTQASREGGKDGSEKLTMSAARDTGAIEESSDYMLGVYRPAANAKLTEDERQSLQHEMYCQILKNRWGRTGEVKLYFEGMTKRIEDWRG